MDAIDLPAVDSVEGQVVQTRRGEIVRRGVAVLRRDGREDEPLRAPGRIASLPGAPVVVARDLHVAQH